MALTQNTVLDKIEVTRDGTLQIRFGLEVMNGTQLISSAWHRTSVAPGGDVDAQMASVNAHLSQMGQNAATSDHIATIKSYSSVAWTPDVVSAYAATMQTMKK
jgi:hypothetical protein